MAVVVPEGAQEETVEDLQHNGSQGSGSQAGQGGGGGASNGTVGGAGGTGGNPGQMGNTTSGGIEGPHSDSTVFEAAR